MARWLPKVLLACALTLTVLPTSSVACMPGSGALVSEIDCAVTDLTGPEPPLDLGDQGGWSGEWWRQGEGVNDVRRFGDRVVIADPYAWFEIGLAERWAPCDPTSNWNGFDGRWYKLPTEFEYGTTFQAIQFWIQPYDEAPAPTPNGVTIVQAGFYRQNQDESCEHIDTVGYTSRPLPIAIPGEATHLYVAPTVPLSTDPDPVTGDVQFRLSLRACLNTNCPAGGAGWSGWTHPNPEPDPTNARAHGT